MKTFAAVLCAMFATAGSTFAHGTAGGVAVGSPVVSPFGLRIVTPIVLPSTQDASSIRNDRRHKQQPVGYLVGTYYESCPPAYAFTPFDDAVGQGGPPICDDQVPEPAAFPIPYWPPAFLW